MVFYISHRLDEIFRFCDTVTVLEGRALGLHRTDRGADARPADRADGRPLSCRRCSPRDGTAPGPAALEGARADAATARRRQRAPLLRRGEIVGMGGWKARASAIIRALAGALPPVSCDIVRHDREGQVQPFDPATAWSRWCAPRRGPGARGPSGRRVVPELPIADNIRLARCAAWGLIKLMLRERGVIEQMAKQPQPGSRDLVQPVGDPVGRQPAEGDDRALAGRRHRHAAGRAAYTRRRRRRQGRDLRTGCAGFVQRGGAVLALPSDPLELIGLCDRILMVRPAASSATCRAEGATEEAFARTGAGRRRRIQRLAERAGGHGTNSFARQQPLHRRPAAAVVRPVGAGRAQLSGNAEPGQRQRADRRAADRQPGPDGGRAGGRHRPVGGSVMSLAGCLAATQADPLWGVTLALALGLCVGPVNGPGVAVAGIHPLVMTLSTMTFPAGPGLPVAADPRRLRLPPVLGALANGNLWGVPRCCGAPPARWRCTCCRTTRLGLHIFAVGANAAARTLNGVRAVAVVVSAYGLQPAGGGGGIYPPAARVSSGDLAMGGLRPGVGGHRGGAGRHPADRRVGSILGVVTGALEPGG